ncbi:hypothetical protein HDU92_004303 [Lobulomyces angularis]|nr:hypothetical protein HDU92_004303 [Lobulomyces angularis]
MKALKFVEKLYSNRKYFYRQDISEKEKDQKPKEFSNVHFIKGKPELLKNILRKTNPNTSIHNNNSHKHSKSLSLLEDSNQLSEKKLKKKKSNNSVEDVKFTNLNDLVQEKTKTYDQGVEYTDNIERYSNSIEKINVVKSNLTDSRLDHTISVPSSVKKSLTDNSEVGVSRLLFHGTDDSECALNAKEDAVFLKSPVSSPQSGSEMMFTNSSFDNFSPNHQDTDVCQYQFSSDKEGMTPLRLLFNDLNTGITNTEKNCTEFPNFSYNSIFLQSPSYSNSETNYPCINTSHCCTYPTYYSSASNNFDNLFSATTNDSFNPYTEQQQLSTPVLSRQQLVTSPIPLEFGNVLNSVNNNGDSAPTSVNTATEINRNSTEYINNTTEMNLCEFLESVNYLSFDII